MAVLGFIYCQIEHIFIWCFVNALLVQIAVDTVYFQSKPNNLRTEIFDDTPITVNTMEPLLAAFLLIKQCKILLLCIFFTSL